MRKAVILVILVFCLVTPSPIGAKDGDGSLRILTCPIGLVTGEKMSAEATLN